MKADLAILQARLHSNRIPRKMLQDVGGHPLLWWGWSTANWVFGSSNVVVAMVKADEPELGRALPGAAVFAWDGDVNDVLGRVHAAAHECRKEPTDVIYRLTPDDFPIDPWRERCTLSELDHWHATVTDPHLREHIGHLFKSRLEINTPADLEEARRRVQ